LIVLLRFSGSLVPAVVLPASMLKASQLAQMVSVSLVQTVKQSSLARRVARLAHRVR